MMLAVYPQSSKSSTEEAKFQHNVTSSRSDTNSLTYSVGIFQHTNVPKFETTPLGTWGITDL